MTVPIVSIVGSSSNSGKTTLIERLIPELKKRGYRVATIKSAQEIDFEPGKDSSRHLQAGSELTAVATSKQIVLMTSHRQLITMDKVVSLMGHEFDIILCEGFKHADVPKIEVHFKPNEPLLEGITKIMAIVTNETLNTKMRRFSFDDIEGIADLLEKGFIKPEASRLDLYINDIHVPLKRFPRQLISQTVLGAVSSLKEIGAIRSLKILFRRESKEREK